MNAACAQDKCVLDVGDNLFDVPPFRIYVEQLNPALPFRHSVGNMGEGVPH